MTSILRKLRGSRRKSRTKPNINSWQQDYDGRLSVKSTDSSHASDVDSRPRKPLQLMDDDDRTHPMLEQSPAHYSVAKSDSKRHINFSFVRRKSDPKIRGLATGQDKVANAPLKRRLRKQPPDQPAEVDTAPRRMRFGLGSKKSKDASQSSTRLDASGHLHHQRSADEQDLNRETERIARAAAALDNRGNELFERGYFDKAMEAYSKALKLKRRTFHSMLEEADEVLEEDGDVDYDKTDPKLLVSMATSINNIGYLRQRAGDATPDETMAAYKKSLRIKRKILGNDSLSVGKTLNNVGSVHYLKKEFDGAIPAYEEALQIMQANLGDGHPDVATVMSNMGDVYLAKGDAEKGLEHYRMALNIRWAAFGEKDPRVVRLLEKIARIEIGDRMTPKGADAASQTMWDESDLFDLDARPLTEELHTLHEEVEEDMQYVDLLQKRMAVDMVKDKVNILRGMRELWADTEAEDALQRGGSREDEGDTAPVSPDGASNHSRRSQAQQHVKDRLAKLRSRKAPDLSQNGHESASKLNGSGSQLQGGHDSASSASSWQQSKNNIYGASFYSPHSKRKSLSAMQPGEIKGEVNNIRSALKLKKGINSLRSLECDDASLNSAFSMNSKNSRKSQISKTSQR